MLVVGVVLCSGLKLGSVASAASQTVTVYNNQTIIPDTHIYCYAVAEVSYVDDPTARDIWFCCVSNCLLLNSLSSVNGTGTATLTVNSRDVFIEEMGFDIDEIRNFIWLGQCVFISSSSPVNPYFVLDQSYSLFPTVNYFSEFFRLYQSYDDSPIVSLLSGIPFNTVQNYSSVGSGDTAIATYILHAFNEGVSINNARATSSDTAEATALLTMPQKPTFTQDGFLDGTAVVWWGDFIGKIIPASLIVPLLSLLAFGLVISLLLMLRHA